MGLSLIGRNQQGRKEKLSFPLNPGQSSLSLLLLVEDQKKEEEKALFLSLICQKSQSLSLPWLKLVLLSHPWLKIRRRRKGSFSLP